MSYIAGNVFQLDSSFTFRCYICNELIDPSKSLSRDHVIPKTLFNTEKTNRPTIDVHVPCNNNDKSKDDTWFAKIIFYKSLLNPIASKRFSEFLESAERSRTNHKEKTKSDVSNERLLRTILQETQETGILQNETREEKYVKMLCRGLIIRNSWHIKCDAVKVLSVHRPTIGERQNIKLDDYIKTTFLDQLNSCIHQFWDKDILYVINPKENLIYLEFYSQQIYIVGFDYELPTIVSAKKHVTHEQLENTQISIDAYNKVWQQL